MRKSHSPPQKAVIYCRVSGVKQTKEGDGLASQETRCREFAAHKHLEVVQVFKDDMSGSVVNRPAMMAMLKFLKTQKSTHIVIIDDISRLARGLDAHLKLRVEINAVGGVLQSPSIEFGEDSDSLLVENLLASVSQHQRQKNGEQTRNRMRARIMNGYWAFPAPIGYVYTRVTGSGKMLKRDEVSGSVLQQAFEDYAAGALDNLADVMRFLAAHPLWPAKRKKSLTIERVIELFTRPLYAGYLHVPEWGINMVEAKHEPLISFETFRAVQARMKAAKKTPARKEINREFPLRGYVSCSCCGEKYTACWSRGRSKSYAYYLCQTKGCENYGRSIRRDVIEAEFEEMIKSLRPTMDVFDLVRDMFRELWDAKVESEKSASAMPSR